MTNQSYMLITMAGGANSISQDNGAKTIITVI